MESSKDLDRKSALETLIDKSSTHSDSITTPKILAKILSAEIDIEESKVSFGDDPETGFDFTKASLFEKESGKTKIESVDQGYDVTAVRLGREGHSLQLASELKSADRMEMTLSAMTTLKIASFSTPAVPIPSSSKTFPYLGCLLCRSPATSGL